MNYTRKSIKMLLIVGLIFLFVTVAAAGITWNPVVIISGHGDGSVFDDQNPRIATDTRGNSYVVWEGFDGNDQEIYWVKLDSKGTPGPPVLISTHPDNEQNSDRHPYIVADSSGSSYVVWEGFDGNDQEIYWVKLDSKGESGPVIKISTHPDNEEYNDQNPYLVIDNAGSSYVVWEGFDGNDQEIYWSRIDSDGIPGEPHRISNHADNIVHNDKNPQIAVNSAGTSFIVWNGFDGMERHIYWSVLAFNGEKQQVKLIPVPEGVHGDARNPCIQLDVLDNSYVVWSIYNGSDEDIYWAKVDASGDVMGVECISNHETDVFDRNPHLAMDSYRESHVVWEGYGTHEEIYWVKVNPLGIFTPPRMISTHTDNKTWGVYHPQVASDSSGNSYVVWDGYDGIDEEIYWVKVDFYGEPGIVMKISTHSDNTYGYDRDPHITVSPAGTSYVTWSGFNGTDEEIYFTITTTDPSGPQTQKVEFVESQPYYISTKVTIIATIDDSKTGASTIQSAEYFIDKVGPNGTGTRMAAADGAFDSSTEIVNALIDMGSLSTGAHIVYIHGQDIYGNWGPFHSIFLRVYYVTAT
jgi:hypothetical protein